MVFGLQPGKGTHRSRIFIDSTGTEWGAAQGLDLGQNLGSWWQIAGKPLGRPLQYVAPVGRVGNAIRGFPAQTLPGWHIPLRQYKQNCVYWAGEEQRVQAMADGAGSNLHPGQGLSFSRVPKRKAIDNPYASERHSDWDGRGHQKAAWIEVAKETR